MTAGIRASSSLALRPVRERGAGGTPGWNVEDLTPFLPFLRPRRPSATPSRRGMADPRESDGGVEQRC